MPPSLRASRAAKTATPTTLSATPQDAAEQQNGKNHAMTTLSPENAASLAFTQRWQDEYTALAPLRAALLREAMDQANEMSSDLSAHIAYLATVLAESGTGETQMQMALLRENFAAQWAALLQQWSLRLISLHQQRLEARVREMRDEA